ncbi:MAG: transketolase family protein [Chitinivibrionales bacterium]|nr:transketolase family protein [Chitinivibrionales bacterium]MBD3396094.1 transketolase family protein [Chitinivibrionales bacterium]
MVMRKAKKATRKAFAERMKEYGAHDPSFVVFEADIGYSTYSYLFGDEYPDRYFNMGIAEANMVGAAAGMAAGGRTVIACGYGVFLSMRALETVRTFICYPNLNVKFLSSHGGVTAAIDGVTHQATEDIGMVTTLPNMSVVAPADENAARAMVEVAVNTPGPVFVRAMRDPLYNIYDADETFETGGSKIVRDGADITIVSYGDILFEALEAAEELRRMGISAEVIDMYSIKPFDKATLLGSLEKTGALLVAENHQKRNGLGYELAAFCLTNKPVPFDHLGLQDTFAESGNYYKVLDKYGLSHNHIVAAAGSVVKKKQAEVAFA